MVDVNEASIADAINHAHGWSYGAPEFLSCLCAEKAEFANVAILGRAIFGVESYVEILKFGPATWLSITESMVNYVE